MRRAAPVLLLLTCAGTNPVTAQVDVHAEALTRASCQAGRQSESVQSATTALEHNPEDLGPRLRLADALVDQGCYQEAVIVLEAGQEGHSHSNELAGKLRDIRSLVTEQTYIEGLTQAAEGAKLQRNQLRCTRLADVTACDDALNSRPDDAQLLIAKGDALMQRSRAVDAVAAYRHAAQLRPADEAVKSKLTAAETLLLGTAGGRAGVPASAAAQIGGANRSASGSRQKVSPGPAAIGSTVARTLKHAAPSPLVAGVATLEEQSTRTYSNDAPPGQTN